MILFHMSDTLKLGDEMALDFKKTMSLAQPLYRHWKRVRIASMPWF